MNNEIQWWQLSRAIQLVHRTQLSGTSSFPKANSSRSDSTHEKQALTNFSVCILGRRIFKHSRSFWIGPAMSSCSLVVPTRELDSLEESLLIFICSRSPLMGAFFFCVSSVVTNARSARTVGPSVEELTCSKSQRWGSRHLIGVNGGDMLCFDQCTIGNVNGPASPVEQAFYGMTGCDNQESTMVPEAKHTGWRKKSLSCLTL
jgi:hypothetical protein